MYRILARRKTDKREMIREYAPIKRSLVYLGGRFNLQFPTMIFMIRRSRRLGIAWADGPIKSWSQRVYAPPVGNLYGGCGEWRMCQQGSTVLKTAINNFWGSEFNDDGDIGNETRYIMFPTASCFDYGSQYRKWEESSLETIQTKMKKLKRIRSQSFWKFVSNQTRRPTIERIEELTAWEFDLKADFHVKRGTKAALKRLGVTT
jgi:hypothetical protein